MAEERKESKVEVIKRDSHHLRGRIVEELQQDTTHFTEESIQVLKFHGMYQQDDRDIRAQRKKEGLDKAYSMMIRARIPGGILTADQYLQFDKISDAYGNGTMRITTRQTFQLHGILKGNIKKTLQGINEVLITTLGGCGDQVRNTVSCAKPANDLVHQRVRADLLELVDTFSAKTNAYHEIWLNGEKVSFDEEEEPIYKDVYLPRKFKLAIAFEGDNCVDVYDNDLGIVAHPNPDGETVAGYTLLVGGGMGRTASVKTTYPRLATPIAFVKPEELVETARQILCIQRDYGERADRRYARFKYLLDRKGLDWFKSELESRLGKALTPPRDLVWENATDHLGWHQHDGNQWFLGLFVENGRVKDEGEFRLKSVLREITAQYRPSVHLTTQQNIILGHIREQDRLVIEAKLHEAGIKLPEEWAVARKHSMACVALPTCGLATAESERVMPSVMTGVEAMLADLGLADEPITIRMTGCPNGCARPYSAEIAFVGRSPGKYDLFLGGEFYGTRLNEIYRELTPIEEFDQTLRPLFAAFVSERLSGERFGDFCHRMGFEYLRGLQPVAN